MRNRNNIKRLWLFFLLTASYSISYSQENRTFSDNTIKAKYSLNHGRINGKYVSFYPNGKKKAQGNFENNYRTGKWIVWDSIGDKRVERVYSTPFVFERLVPEVPQEGPIPLVSKPVYNIEYNDKGYIEYFPINERMVIWLKIIWRTIEKPNNSVLFNDDFLFKTMLNLVTDSIITAYSGADDEFQKKIDISSLDIENLEVIRYKIKEEWFFDNERFVMECRIIGICPIVQIDHDTTELFWLYFPELREHFAKETIEPNEAPEDLKSLDDLFFYRFFSGTIYKESNVHEREIADYMKTDEIEKEAERIEIGLIESEHDIWLNMTDKK